MPRYFKTHLLSHLNVFPVFHFTFYQCNCQGIQNVQLIIMFCNIDESLYCPLQPKAFKNPHLHYTVFLMYLNYDLWNSHFQSP